MKERPILFSGPMVRAILDGRKTQTRRVLKPQPTWVDTQEGGHWYLRGYERRGGSLRNVYGGGFDPAEYAKSERGAWFSGSGCPYGQPGDRLWVRETFQICSNFHVDCRDDKPPFSDGRPVKRNNDPDYPVWEQCYYAASDKCPELLSPETEEIEARWRPSIHMPRWASRILLEIVSVRVERLQDISEADAKAEGAQFDAWVNANTGNDLDDFTLSDSIDGPWCHRNGFANLWQSINGPESWQANPWVWVIEFKRVEK